MRLDRLFVHPTYPQSSLRLFACALSLSVLGGCSESKRFDDAGAAGSASHEDGGAEDAAANAADGGDGLGQPCKRDADCPSGLFCDEEIPSEVPVSGSPSGSIDLPLFPGGSCSPRPLTPYDPDGGTSCDPAAPKGDQGCGEHGACVSESVESGTLVACRVACEPSADSSGCEHPHYTCDFGLHACVEGCGSDDECRVLSVDSDGDGLADALAYDDASKATCDSTTARCTHPAPANAAVGSACERNDDCEADGTCVRGENTLAGHTFPGGACIKLGCQVEGRECGEGAVCEALRPWSNVAKSSPVCLSRCKVGGEPAAQRLGKSGHGEGCRAGYRCHYNGGAGAADGVCVGGNYNAVAQNNVGASCKVDGDCYSPFGYGRCLRLRVGDVGAATGTCTVMDCSAPGLPKDVCGTGNQCILLRDDITFCVRTCSAASDCAQGFACADDDGSPSTPSICFPACFGDDECRKGKETCEIAAGVSAGQCVALTGKGG